MRQNTNRRRLMCLLQCAARQAFAADGGLQDREPPRLKRRRWTDELEVIAQLACGRRHLQRRYFYPSHLFSRRAVFPHAAMYRGLLPDVLNDSGMIAAPRPQPPFASSTVAAGGMALALTCCPGATNRDAAQTINVDVGQTVSGIEFSMISTPAYQGSGVVVDEMCTPLSDPVLTLMIDPQNVGSGAPMMGRTDRNGTFRIGGVASARIESWELNWLEGSGPRVSLRDEHDFAETVSSGSCAGWMAGRRPFATGIRGACIGA